MKNETFDFYSPLTLKSYNLNETMKYQLQVLEQVDFFTRRHSENVANLCCRICEYLHCNKNFTIYCTICAYLHDLGKIFIPKEILEKPGKLTSEEYEVMKKHTTLGYDMCIKDLNLRPYAAGALNHHEALNGTGYPNGLTKSDIPYEAQIIRVADEYDALVTKRQYITHVNISETLKDLIKDSNPDPALVALDYLSENSKVGKINKKILNVLFKVVIEDILYEISGIMNYVSYLKNEIKRLEQMKKYDEKAQNSDKGKTKSYYLEGIKLLLQQGETIENFKDVLKEYQEALNLRQERIDSLYNEIKIIKKLKA